MLFKYIFSKFKRKEKLTGYYSLPRITTYPPIPNFKPARGINNIFMTDILDELKDTTNKKTFTITKHESCGASCFTPEIVPEIILTKGLYHA